MVQGLICWAPSQLEEFIFKKFICQQNSGSEVINLLLKCPTWSSDYFQVLNILQPFLLEWEEYV